MKTIEETKKSMIMYVESDIDTLSEQNEEKEARAYISRVRGALGAMSMSDIITADEAKILEDKLAEARKNAEQNILNNK
ncbi:MAG: hypothetical protein PHI47_10525 [Sulfuricurvum sp.]|uniref:hypothetical protein n=1 Tax=Sulfuricurvum sp. TaxID=2025608 RepID=UPI002613B121|nr:hypothetical protein [Sulfuricurvum sp.]MDD5160476.1 hypothetical protein [Sulfuricurvum sp.]